LIAAACALLSAPAGAQTAMRMAANVPALLKYPAFYHLRSIVVRGELTTGNDRTMLVAPGGDRAIEVVIKNGRRPDGEVEIRGVYWDIGRMTSDDPRFAGFDIQSFLDARTAGAWPKPGDLTVIAASDVAPAPPLLAPSVRAMVLDPLRYENQKVTVVGVFRGSNLYGDLPKAPTSGKWDFVLRGVNGAVWVTGVRPKGKGFDLDPHARIDTGRVLEVSGVVKSADGLVWLEANTITAPAITAVQPRDEPSEAEATPPPPPMPAPAVIFSLPTEGETDVSPSAPVRIQVSRNLDPATFADRIRVSYVGAAVAGAPQAPAISIATTYNAADRVVEIRFAKPLAPYRMVKVELLDGIKGTDGQLLKPWSLTFTTGSQ
jgi:hypothetical protein